MYGNIFFTVVVIRLPLTVEAWRSGGWRDAVLSTEANDRAGVNPSTTYFCPTDAKPLVELNLR